MGRVNAYNTWTIEPGTANCVFTGPTAVGGNPFASATVPIQISGLAGGATLSIASVHQFTVPTTLTMSCGLATVAASRRRCRPEASLVAIPVASTRAAS